MTITYAIWQGGKLLAHSQKAESIKAIDSLMDELNDTKIGKQKNFSANITMIEVNK
jgi:hypothetical protein